MIEDVFAILEQERPGFMKSMEFAKAHVGTMESPLEELFLAQWVFLLVGAQPCLYSGSSEVMALPCFNLTSQAKIEGYRVDFLLDVLELGAKPVARAVIEIDGFAYHKSKESFIADRKRDQALTAAGYTVFRFTMDSLVEHNPLRHLVAWTRKVRPLVDEPGRLGRALRVLSVHPHA